MPYADAKYPHDRRLVEAAPQLLEALKILRVQCGDYTDGDGAQKYHACNIADRAIEKAEGGANDTAH